VPSSIPGAGTIESFEMPQIFTMNAPEFLLDDWCGLRWSAWLPFDGGDFKSIDRGAGLYRIRATGSASIAYIGQTGRNLHERLTDLRRHTMADLMPFNDPHPAASSLWAWRHAAGYGFACSVAATGVHRRIRLAIECWLLWKYRLTAGASTLCNHGHFHSAYVKSGNRSTKLRGGQRSKVGDTCVQISSHPPLILRSIPSAQDWMGLEWSGRYSLGTIPAGGYPALYRIFDAKTEKLLYFGETQNFGQRMRSHAQKDWNGRAPVVSFCRMPESISKVHLHELENDLIGAYFEASRAAPELQFSGGN
jgi:hypothetical protein